MRLVYHLRLSAYLRLSSFLVLLCNALRMSFSNYYSQVERDQMDKVNNKASTLVQLGWGQTELSSWSSIFLDPPLGIRWLSEDTWLAEGGLLGFERLLSWGTPTLEVSIGPSSAIRFLMDNRTGPGDCKTSHGEVWPHGGNSEYTQCARRLLLPRQAYIQCWALADIFFSVFGWLAIFCELLTIRREKFSFFPIF